MPNHTRYGLILLLLIVIALSVPLMAVASQANDPTPLITLTALPTLSSPLEVTEEATEAPTQEPTAAPPIEATLELTAEATQDGQQIPIPTERPEPVDKGALEVGDTVEDALTAEEPAHVYTFSGVADQAITVTLVSEEFDTYLVLEDEDGNILDTDDDSAGNFDSRITITLPADGDYRIIAQSFSYYNNSGGATGDYTISVEERQVRRIEYSQTVQGELTSDELAQTWTFTGQEGDSVRISLSSPSYDTYLTLFDDSGLSLMYNDDSGGTLNSMIGPYVLPYTGTYVIEANSYSRSSTGSYTLSLDKVELQAIAYGDTVDVDITEGSDTFFFTFEGNTGEIVNIFVNSDGAVDTNLQLTDPYNSVLTSDQDSGRRYDPEIIDFVLTTTGMHTIVLDTVSGTGTVQLVLERGVIPSLDEGPQQISFSSSGSNPTRVVSFTATAGQNVRLTLTIANNATNGSPNLTVWQQGSTVAYGSFSYVTGASLDFTPTYSGETLITINEYAYTDITYEVSLEPVE